MNKTKALKKDLKNKFAGTINEVVTLEDPKPSKKVKKLISKSSKKLASAVVKDNKEAKKKAIKAEKKAAKAEKKAAKPLNGLKAKKEKKVKEVEIIG
ncbi:MAG: hypothetical protein JNK44_13040 [Cyclobacteriaceae bacterium]|nr:hypothetical protein [Cyclobacteriaceae bacterium]